MNAKNNAIILLSGGLDSFESLAVIKNEMNNILALTFDYGQKSLKKEIESSSKIAKFYNIDYEIVTLDWLKNISSSTLNTKQEIPFIKTEDLDDKLAAQKSANSVWVPNRNAVFINIAASFADSKNYNYIIIGANKEEAKTFKDNSIQFIQAINNSLKNSTINRIEVISPLINMDKTAIVKTGIELNIPFEYMHSCYLGGEKHCGKCESCLRLKRALELNNGYDIITDIFE